MSSGKNSHYWPVGFWDRFRRLASVGGNAAGATPWSDTQGLTTPNAAPEPRGVVVYGEPQRIRRMNVIHSRPIGVGGTSIVGGMIDNEEHVSAIKNEKGYGEWGVSGIYEKMRRSDPHIARSLRLVTLPLQAATWEFDPASQDPAHVEHAKFCNWNLNRIKWQATLRQALLYKPFGFSLFEVMEDIALAPADEFPSIPGTRDISQGFPQVPAFVWAAWEARLPRTIHRWVAKPNRPSEVQSVIQYAGYSDGDVKRTHFPEISHVNLIRFTNEQEGGNFQGQPILRPVYKSWSYLTKLEKLDAIRHERQNVGIPKITLPENSTDADIEKAEVILAHLSSHEKGYLVLPFGWAFAWDTSGQGTGTDVRTRIQDLKRDIADNVLAGFMALGNGDTGSYALADTQVDQYLLQLEVDASYIAETINEGSDGVSHVRRLVDNNFGPQRLYPVCRAKNLKSKDWGQILSYIVQLVQQGTLRKSSELENRIRQMLELPPLEESQDPGPSLIIEEAAADVLKDPEPRDSEKLETSNNSDDETEAKETSKSVESESEEEIELRAYHLTTNVVKMNEARTRFLGLPRDPRFGDMTVSEYLKQIGSAGFEDDPGSESVDDEN